MLQGGTRSLDSQIRIESREALLGALDGKKEAADLLLGKGEQLREQCEAGFRTPDITKRYSLYAALIQCASRLSSWSIAVRNCEADADRYLRGAKVLAQDAVAAAGPEIDEPFSTCFVLIDQITKLNDVGAVLKAVASIPLPISHPVERRRGRVQPPTSTERKPQRTVVAFASFCVNSARFQKDHLLHLDIVYDLEVEVRLSEWPENEQELRLEPLSVEPSDSYELPTFSFTRISGKGPFSLKATKRMVLKRATSFLARPLEFSYRARFVGATEITTEGQRHLSVRCFDPKSEPQSGYEQVDLRLVEIRDQARRASGINDFDLNNLLILMGAVGGIAGQALQDNLFPGVWKELDFQAELKRLLRSRPTVGAELEEHPHVSGGITDLSFRSIRLELKVVHNHHVTRDDVLKYLPQVSQYVAASDKRFGMLCVLDSSAKDSAPGLPSEDMSYEVVRGPSGQGLPIGIGVVVIRGNLAVPSSLKSK
jgi:hypothetical protein